MRPHTASLSTLSTSIVRVNEICLRTSNLLSLAGLKTGMGVQSLDGRKIRSARPAELPASIPGYVKC